MKTFREELKKVVLRLIQCESAAESEVKKDTSDKYLDEGVVAVEAEQEASEDTISQKEIAAAVCASEEDS